MTTKIPAELSSTPGIADSSNATAITIDSSENVGIGETSPDLKLHIKSSGQIAKLETTASTGDCILTFADAAANKAFVGFGSSSSELFQISNVENGDMKFDTNNTERMRITSAGNITKPDNCSFSAKHSTTVSNFSIGSYVQVPFDTEIYDNGGNLASTGTFTAPVTGRYLLCATVRFGSVDASATYSRIIIATSNRSYQGTLLDHSTVFSGDADYHVYFAHFIADMDANDTANVSFYQLGGAAQADLAGDESFFQGELIG